jgi:hypothetical protein
MSTAVRFSVYAIAVVVVGWLWWRYDGATIPVSSLTQAPEPTQANEATVETPVAPVTATVATEVNVADLPPSPRTEPHDEMAALVRKMADRAYKTFGPQIVEYLISKGLSGPDSERAVADAMPDWVRCQLDATLAQADEQSISRAAVVEVLDASGLLFAAPAGLDMRAAIARALPCRMSVQQRIGIPDGRFEFRRTDAR